MQVYSLHTTYSIKLTVVDGCFVDADALLIFLMKDSYDHVLPELRRSYPNSFIFVVITHHDRENITFLKTLSHKNFSRMSH